MKKLDMLAAQLDVLDEDQKSELNGGFVSIDLSLVDKDAMGANTFMCLCHVDAYQCGQ